jgi:hypothetical protein
VAPDVHSSLAPLARSEPADPAALERLVAATGGALPEEYLAFVAINDGGESDVGDSWIEFWSAGRVLSIRGRTTLQGGRPVRG